MSNTVHAAVFETCEGDLHYAIGRGTSDTFYEAMYKSYRFSPEAYPELLDASFEVQVEIDKWARARACLDHATESGEFCRTCGKRTVAVETKSVRTPHWGEDGHLLWMEEFDSLDGAKEGLKAKLLGDKKRLLAMCRRVSRTFGSARTGLERGARR